MDAEKFDRLTQTLGAGLSRRGALRAAIGTAVLGSLGLNQPDEASAKKNKNKNKKKKCLKKLGSNTCQTCNKKGKLTNKANGTGCSTTLGSGQCAEGSCIVQATPLPSPPSPICVTPGNPCAQGAPSPNACCDGSVCGKRFGTGNPNFCCNNTRGTCNTAETAAQCCNGCDTGTAPPTCACKTAGTACDDSSQCCQSPTPLQCRATGGGAGTPAFTCS